MKLKITMCNIIKVIIGILLVAIHGVKAVVPISEILLYPNTQDSPSLYMIGFKISTEMEAGEYLLFNMDWLANSVNPYHCILVNTSINIKCTNFATPKFTLSFDQTVMSTYNSRITPSRSIIIQLIDPITPGTDYFMQISLHNTVENIKRFSPAAQFYCLNKDGLVYQQNRNFGSVSYKPPVLPPLSVSVLNDLSANIPGVLSTLKAQIQITVPIATSLSALIFILQDPFKYSDSSYLRVDQSESYATNPIALYGQPVVKYFEIKSPNIFYVAFDEQFVAGRKFIIEITEIKNPFFIAVSNVSIYSADFNSLTPLQQFQQLYPLSTATQSLSLTVGLPYDMPMQGPCVIYRDRDNFFKVTFNMPISLPAGYSIKLYSNQITVKIGTAYINFESLDYTTVYSYTTSTIIMKGMGPMEQGSLIYILFKGYKSSTTGFYIDISIDTESIIADGTATDYMLYGRFDGTSEPYSSFLGSVYDSLIWNYLTITSYQNLPQLPTTYYNNYYIRVQYSHGYSTNAGSYADIYFPPNIEFDPLFDGQVDCQFQSNAWGSAICTPNKTSNFVHIIVKGSPTYLVSNPNPFPAGTQYFYIRKIRFPQITTNKFPHFSYFRLFGSSGVNPTTYNYGFTLTVVPPRNALSTVSLIQSGNILDDRYPQFVRFQSTSISQMDFPVEQNQVRVLAIGSRYRFRGMGTIANQDPYPCTSNIKISCYFSEGNSDYYYFFNEWDKIIIYFHDDQEILNKFHIIIPDNVPSSNDHRWIYYLGVYNKLTKDYRYMYRNDYYIRNGGWTSLNTFYKNSGTYIDLNGKAGSYRTNISVNVASSSGFSNGNNYLVVHSAWSLFENGKTQFTVEAIGSSTPVFGTVEQSPVSTPTKNGMYMTVIPFYCLSCPSSFSFTFNYLHMPYHYDLPNYYIYVLNPAGYLISYNEFQMTNGNLFYEAYLKSLTITCQQNYLGVKNTICDIVFGTQSPLKADANISIVLSGMNIATDICEVFLHDSTKLDTTCRSTEDNKNVSIKLTDTNGVYHYVNNNFTIRLRGLSIQDKSISQSFTVYVHENTGKKVIQKGTRIFTTTVARPSSIEIYEIIYDYLSPLSANKMSITFFLPRGLYDDERLGFIMGKDLSDVNLEIKRFRIVLTRISDGVVLQNTNEMISSEYKILFTLKDRTMIIEGNYSLEIYGIMTPASHQNGAFSIIYQRKFDKSYTLTNTLETSFPEFGDRKISDITVDSFFNTEGFQQKLVFTLKNQDAVVNDQMIWVINFPSYYSQQIFNFDPYCLIDNTPIQCYSDPTTPYQIIIKNSPKIISLLTTYTISVFRLACPRSSYTNDYFQSRYLFIGVLENSNSEQYSQTALLYPEQSIQSYISGSLVLTDILVTTLTMPSFSSIYSIFNFKCNVDITANSYFYLVLPTEFDNLNNNPLSIVLKKLFPSTIILYSGQAQVTDRTISFQINQIISANTPFSIEFPSLPTPKSPTTVRMSSTLGYISATNKKSVYAASAISSNSAPVLTFTQDPRYISFNHDTTIDITAGTYSQMIDVQSSDSEQFLTNIVVNISSLGFTFEPTSLFLQLGNQKQQFRVGADSDLIPISYFYDTTKSQQTFTYYTITKNNNIRVTNTPVGITLPASINIPMGGCSEPYTISINNAPMNDLSIVFNYDNSVYDQDLFWPNQYLTKSQLQFLPNVTQQILSFCVNKSIQTSINSGSIPSTFKLTFILSGTNYASYRFLPSQQIPINILPSTSVPTPIISLQTINQQKTFITFNLTTNTQGIIYYHFQVGNQMPTISDIDIKISIKNNKFILKSMNDYYDRMYLDDRDQRVGYLVKNVGQHSLTISDLLPQRFYTLCVYLETQYNVISQARCLSAATQNWGNVVKSTVSFSSVLAAESLNKVLCFFTKSADTEVKYLVDLQGNSCHNKKVKNMHFNYPGTTFSNQAQATHIYMLTNPYISSDPSITAFTSLYNVSSQLSAASLASAVSGFAINYLSSKLISSLDGYSMLSSTNADQLTVSFDKPEFFAGNNTILVNNVKMSGQGTVYFVLLLYKEIVIDGNNSYVNIRLSTQPSKEQILNCENWENLQAEGCARAVYSTKSIAVTFNNIRPNCMYKLYYITASQFPLRPILASEIINDTVVTFTKQNWMHWYFSALLVLSLLSFI